MKVDIKHSERTEGMIRKTTYPVVSVKVDFSEEEQQIIKQNKLENYILVERGIPANLEKEKFAHQAIADRPQAYSLKVRDLMRSDADSYAFHAVHEAKNYVQRVKEALPSLKNMLDGNVEAGEDESFEL